MMKINKILMILGFLFLVNILMAKSSGGMGKLGYSDIYKSDFEQYGFMVNYSPTNSGYGLSFYGMPQGTEFTARFSYFSLYMERKGSFKGGEFEGDPLVIWENTSEDIHRKYVLNLGTTQSVIPNNKLIIVYFAGVGFYEEFQQYESIYGNYWFENNEKKVIANIGAELIARIGFLNIGAGASYQSHYYFSLGFEF